MLKKTITYIDYDGVERTETHWFNLTKAELAMMNLSEEGGLERKFEKITEKLDTPAVVKVFQDIIRASYGEKSSDGRRFIKDPKLFEEFSQTEAYSQLVIELLTDPKATADFAAGIIPKDLADAVKAEMSVTE